MAIYEVLHGLVLRETLSKEADKILTVLTAERGKLTVIARGARRKNSRITAASELYVYSELTAYESHGYMMLTEAATIELFPGLRADIEALSLASYFAELTETVTGEGEDASLLLQHLLNAFYALGALKKDPVQVKAAFELRLMALAGFAPLLDACMVCGGSVEEGAAFDIVGGGLLCPACGREKGGAALSPASLAALRHMVTAPAKKLYAFSLDGAAMAELGSLTERYTLSQMERRFSALDYYKSLKLTTNRNIQQE